jgi:hypothetical protein
MNSDELRSASVFICVYLWFLSFVFQICIPQSYGLLLLSPNIIVLLVPSVMCLLRPPCECCTRSFPSAFHDHHLLPNSATYTPGVCPPDALAEASNENTAITPRIMTAI